MFNQEDALDKTKQAFSEWRDSRANRGSIPQYLWDMFISLLSIKQISKINNYERA